MSNPPESKTPPSSRQPLSLRELFCLTTLAAITVAIVLYREWTDEERWLLGLTLGGTLLGILAARLFGRRVWIVGTLAGTAGSSGAVAILGQAWHRQYINDFNPYRGGALDNDELRWTYLTAGAVTLLLGCLLALLTVACYRLTDRATDPGERGLIRTARKHPLQVAVGLSALALAIIAIWRIDFLLQPSAWSPRQCIKLQRPERPMVSGVGNPEAQVRLSHDGKWLAFSVFDLRLEGETYVVQLHQLEPRPRCMALPPMKAATSWRSLPEFSCDEDRCAYLVYEKPWDGTFPWRPDREVHVLDLATSKDETLEDVGNTVTWLPGRKLVVDDRVLSSSANAWSAEEIEDFPEYHPRLGYAIYREREAVRLVELASSREIAVLPGPGGWPAHHSDETYSPNGRFGLIYNEIYDHQLNTTRAWEYDDEQTLIFHTFTRSGYAVGVRNDWTGVSPVQLPWLWYVPLANRLVAWLWREPVCLIDPATGEEIARTQPLWSAPDDIAFSFDGSRMAVTNLEGVYVYDVPAEFR